MIKTKLNIDIAEDGWLEKLPEVEKLSEDIFAEVISELKPEWLEGKKEVNINLSLSDSRVTVCKVLSYHLEVPV